MITVELANQQTRHAIDAEWLQRAVQTVLQGEGVAVGNVSLAIVDDQTIHELNRSYLAHDYPTDVLSFLLSGEGEPLAGEVIVSADTAVRQARRYGWDISHELLLYVVHGTLHLVGYDDATDADRQLMRGRELLYLQAMGCQPRYDDPDDAAEASSSRRDIGS